MVKISPEHITKFAIILHLRGKPSQARVYNVCPESCSELSVGILKVWKILRI